MVRNQKSRIFDHLAALAAHLRRFLGDVKAGLDALHRVQFEEPWARDRRPTYAEWQDYIAPRTPRPRREVAATFAERPATR